MKTPKINTVFPLFRKPLVSPEKEEAKQAAEEKKARIEREKEREGEALAVSLEVVRKEVERKEEEEKRRKKEEDMGEEREKEERLLKEKEEAAKKHAEEEEKAQIEREKEREEEDWVVTLEVVRKEEEREEEEEKKISADTLRTITAVNHEENEQNAFADGGRVEVKDNGKWWTGVISCVHDNGNVDVIFDSDDSESVDVHPSKVRFERMVRLENEGEKVKHKRKVTKPVQFSPNDDDEELHSKMPAKGKEFTEGSTEGSTEEDGNAQSTSAFNASVQLQERHPSEKDSRRELVTEKFKLIPFPEGHLDDKTAREWSEDICQATCMTSKSAKAVLFCIRARQKAGVESAEYLFETFLKTNPHIEKPVEVLTTFSNNLEVKLSEINGGTQRERTRQVVRVLKESELLGQRLPVVIASREDPSIYHLGDLPVQHFLEGAEEGGEGENVHVFFITSNPTNRDPKDHGNTFPLTTTRLQADADMVAKWLKPTNDLTTTTSWPAVLFPCDQISRGSKDLFLNPNAENTTQLNTVSKSEVCAKIFRNVLKALKFSPGSVVVFPFGKTGRNFYLNHCKELSCLEGYFKQTLLAADSTNQIDHPCLGSHPAQFVKAVTSQLQGYLTLRNVGRVDQLTVRQSQQDFEERLSVMLHDLYKKDEELKSKDEEIKERKEEHDKVLKELKEEQVKELKELKEENAKKDEELKSKDEEIKKKNEELKVLKALLEEHDKKAEEVKKKDVEVKRSHRKTASLPFLPSHLLSYFKPKKVVPTNDSAVVQATKEVDFVTKALDVETTGVGERALDVESTNVGLTVPGGILCGVEAVGGCWYFKKDDLSAAVFALRGISKEKLKDLAKQ
ncbi:hypothetical protein TrRE_jg3282, partial [Triparma retinervis]